MLLGTVLNAYIPPQKFAWLNILSLTFPVLMILNISLVIFWIILWKKRAILFLVISLLLLNPTKRWINYNEKSTEVPNLKILTMNIRGGQYGIEKVNDYLSNSDADIIFTQEYGSSLNVSGYKYNVKDYHITAINSKIAVLDHKKIETGANGNSIYADIKVNGKIIRLINIYLNPFAFDKKKVKPSEDLEKNKRKLRYIAGTLLPTFKIHQDEVAAIRKAIDDSPYPVIVGGDFNSVPNSYEYYKISENLTDPFMEVGRGHSTSFHDYKFPIRIDYIFCSKEITPVSYRVDRRQKLSDHYPVVAEFKID